MTQPIAGLSAGSIGVRRYRPIRSRISASEPTPFASPNVFYASLPGNCKNRVKPDAYCRQVRRGTILSGLDEATGGMPL